MKNLNLKFRQYLLILLIPFWLLATQCQMFKVFSDEDRSAYLVDQTSIIMDKKAIAIDNLLSNINLVAPELVEKLTYPVKMAEIDLSQLMTYEYLEYERKNALQVILSELPKKIWDAANKYGKNPNSEKSKKSKKFMELHDYRPLQYVINQCIKLGTDINHKDNLSRTAIMTLFSEKNNKDNPLIHGAFNSLKSLSNLNHKDFNQRSILHHYTNWDKELIYKDSILQTILKEFKPKEELNRMDVFGKSPCTYSSQNGNPNNEINENQKLIKVNLTDQTSPMLCNNIKQDTKFEGEQFSNKNSFVNKLINFFTPSSKKS